MNSLSKLNPASVALIIIDLQQGIVAIPTEPHSSQEVIAKSRELTEIFHRQKALVIHVRVTGAADGKDLLKPDCDEPMASATLPRPKNWAEYVPEIPHGEFDLEITKRQWGAFYGTELDLELRRRGISTIVFCGISTNHGIESTARDAYERGYQLIFVEDAMSGRAAADHQFAVTRIFPRIGKVRKTTEVIAALNS